MPAPDPAPARFHLIPSPDGSWSVRGSAAGADLQTHPTHDEALESARIAAAAVGGGEVLVHDESGDVINVLLVRPRPVKRPRWYVHPRPLAVVLGVMVVALGAWGALFTDHGTPFLSVLWVVVMLIGAAHLVAVGLSWRWRRDRLG